MTLSGKIELKGVGQTWVVLTEASANVHFITSEVQRKWGNKYILVTSDALPVEDSPATQGMYYICITKLDHYSTQSHNSFSAVMVWLCK